MIFCIELCSSVQKIKQIWKAAPRYAMDRNGMGCGRIPESGSKKTFQSAIDAIDDYNYKFTDYIQKSCPGAAFLVSASKDGVV